MSEISIRPMTKLDIDICTKIHTSSFKGFFLTFLGPRFLRELYTDIMLDPTGIAVVAEKIEPDGACQIVGFAVGSMDAPQLYRNLIRHHLRQFAFDGISAVLRKPTIIPRLLRALNKPSESLPVPNAALLMSIAVMPGMQGLGIGKRLIKTFIDETAKLGRSNVMLTTDGVDNDSANHFYQSMGFSLVRTYTTPEGRVLNDYVYTLPALNREVEPRGAAPAKV